MGSKPFGGFLYRATGTASSARWRSRPAPALASRASGPMGGFSNMPGVTKGGSILPRGGFFSLPGDHVRRYMWVSEFVRDRVVLDVGCGHGYGSFYLANFSAKQVVAIDTDSDAIRYARAHYETDNLEFRLIDATRINLPVDTFHAVISFEVIEHLNDPTSYVNGVQSILKDGGDFFLSTPNKRHTELFYVDGNPPNPHHVREYYPEEMHKMLSTVFDIEGTYIEYRKSDLDPTNLERKIRTHATGKEYVNTCIVPRFVRRITPRFLKNWWLRQKGFCAPLSSAGAWREFRIARVQDLAEIDRRTPVQIFHCKKSVRT